MPYFFKKYSPNESLLRDYFSSIGNYRCSAQKNCSLKLQKMLYETKDIDDTDLIKKKIKEDEEKYIPNLNIKIIPCNYEKYMAFHVGRHLVFFRQFSVYEF